jgi:hypothetical protein
MTDAPNGWPDPRKLGVPLHPERDGWHWLSATNSEGETAHFVALWESEEWALPGILSSLDPHEIAAKNTTYLGPCLTPAEVAAREAAAFKRGAEASREQVAHWADAELCDCELADAIRLLPHDLPEDKP